MSLGEMAQGGGWNMKVWLVTRTCSVLRLIGLFQGKISSTYYAALQGRCWTLTGQTGLRYQCPRPESKNQV